MNWDIAQWDWTGILSVVLAAGSLVVVWWYSRLLLSGSKRTESILGEVREATNAQWAVGQQTAMVDEQVRLGQAKLVLVAAGVVGMGISKWPRVYLQPHAANRLINVRNEITKAADSLGPPLPDAVANFAEALTHVVAPGAKLDTAMADRVQAAHTAAVSAVDTRLAALAAERRVALKVIAAHWRTLAAADGEGAPPAQ